MFDIHSVKESVELNPKDRIFFNTETEYQSIPETHKDQIAYLTKQASNWISGFIDNTGLVNGSYTRSPLVKGHYKEVETFVYPGSNQEENLKKWLYLRGIPFQKEVFLMDYYDNNAALLTWKVLIKYSRGIFSGPDKVIFDESLNWCLCQYSVDTLHYAEK